MPVAPSFQDLLDLGKAEAQARRPDLTFLDGDITVAQLHGAAAMADRVVQLGAEYFRATFFHGAKGDDLTELVKDHVDIDRKPATNATGTISITRTSGGAGGTILAGTRFGTAFDAAGNQVIFNLDADLLVGAAANGPFLVSVAAADAGTAGNVQHDQVNQVLDSLFDTFRANNPSDMGGGNLVESDEDLLGRAVLRWSTQQRGTLEALEFGALQVSSVRQATAKEDPTSFAVTVLVSDEDGGSSAQMVADVAAEVENWRAAGAPVQVLGGHTALIDLDIKLMQIRPGFDPADAAQSIIDIVTARIARLKTAQTLFLDTVIAATIAVAPDDIYDVAFTAVVVDGVSADIMDIVPSASATLRAGTITVSGP